MRWKYAAQNKRCHNRHMIKLPFYIKYVINAVKHPHSKTTVEEAAVVGTYSLHLLPHDQ